MKVKRLIVTADDFGLSPEVNQAVIQAHREGILTCASLMVTGRAAGEAIALAREHSNLKIGLHLVVGEGFSVLSKKEIPDLVDSTQRFSDRVVSSGIRYFLSKRAKHQLAKECEAQVERFLDSGLKMDHLNSHHHLHIHPTVADTVIALAKKYRIPAVRLPWQGFRSMKWKSSGMAMVMLPWVIHLRRKLRQSGIVHNQRIFGLYETGNMLEETWLQLLPKLPPGVTEIFCHPAVKNICHNKEGKPSYHHEGEFKALLSSKVKAGLKRERIVLTCFSDIVS